MRPKPGDTDARYTFEAYDLDEEGKTSRRQARQELIEDRLELLSSIGVELAALLDLADEVREANPTAFLEVWGEIYDLRQQARRALEDLNVYRAVPPDAPEDCRCPPPQDLTLPQSLASQCRAID